MLNVNLPLMQLFYPIFIRAIIEGKTKELESFCLVK